MKPLKTILTPTDFSDGSDEAMQYAATLARIFKARILLVHVIEPYTYSMTETFNLVDHYTTLKAIAKPLLDQAAKKLARQGVSVETDLLTGPAHREILQKAVRAKAGLIVMGTHGRTGVEHLLLGSVAEKVVRMSSCPVLTVRGEAKSVTPKKKKGAAADKKAAVTLYG
ncbi:MAG: universal stress protein [Nitrospirae bacterium]|nr:universal stress protein [Nitrospirota bacterium]